MKLLSVFASPRMPFLLLRLGLATVLAYAAISSFMTPDDWVGYLPSMLTDLLDANMLLKLFSAYELLLVIWLLSGWRLELAGLFCGATFAGIIVSNASLLQITFRDIALVFASLALASLAWGQKYGQLTRKAPNRKLKV